MKNIITFSQSSAVSSRRKSGPRPLRPHGAGVFILFLAFIFAHNSAWAQGNALTFNGSNGYVSIPATLWSNNFSNGTAITVEYWFKGSNLNSAYRVQTGVGYIVAGYYNGDGANKTDIISTDALTAGISAGAKATIEDGTWHHLAMTWSKNGLFTSYLDGAQADQRAAANVNLPEMNAISCLGSLGGTTEYLTGSLDEVRIWNNVRTASQISTYKDVELNGNETGLVAYYKMSNGSGTTLADNASGNYPGTLVGGVTWSTGAVIMEQTFSYTGSVQPFTIPAGVSKVTIEVWGAQGGNFEGTLGGYGTHMKGEFSVSTDDVLTIYTGGQGNSNTLGPGGGGGSGVIKGGSPILVAGGGGGASYNGDTGKNASTGTSGVNSSGAGGTDGYGGNIGYYDIGGFDCGYGSGGGGYLSNGAASGSGGGYSPANGGAGGSGGGCASSNYGGWGFGGGGSGAYAGGGGGGYSGGGGGQYRYSSESGLRSGGGGGSYNAGSNQTNLVGSRSGNGLVIITYSSGLNPIISITATLSAFSTCSGTASSSQNFSVSGSGLSNNITITAPTGFEVSKTSGTSGFASSVSLTQSGGTVSSTTIYVRLTNTATGTPSGNISLASDDATTQTLAATGTVTTASVGGTAKW